MTQKNISLYELGQLWNCEHAFQYRCPKEWESLDRTETNGVRYCQECKQQVYFCTTPEDFVRLGNAGHCVAISDDNSPSPLQSAFMGKPSSKRIRSLQELQKRMEEWWSTAIGCKPEFSPEVFSAIEKVIENRHAPLRSLTPEYHKYLTELGEAIGKGPEALYLFKRVRPSGKRESQQGLYKTLDFYFGITFREFIELEKRINTEHPI